MSHQLRATDLGPQTSDPKVDTLPRLRPDAVIRHHAGELFFALDTLTHRRRRLTRILQFRLRNDSSVPVIVADLESSRYALENGWSEH